MRPIAEAAGRCQPACAWDMMVPAMARTYDISLDPDPVIEAYKKDVDRTLLRENLKLTVEERFLALMALQRTAEEMQRAGARSRRNRS
ncbi:MAG: hypothetical protein AB1515_04580 [Nitrospirota bacterium]